MRGAVVQQPDRVPTEDTGMMSGWSLMDAVRFGSSVCLTAGLQRLTSDWRWCEASEARRAAAVSRRDQTCCAPEGGGI